MLKNLRNFAKSKMAGVVIGIIIIPFVFWGMGSVFSGGNSNNIATIDSYNISTQDFVNHLNTANMSSEDIKNNIDQNILEEMLATLVSQSMLTLEIENLNLTISDKILS